MNSSNYLNRIINSFNSYLDSIRDFFYSEPLFGRGQLYSGNLINEQDKKDFIEIFGDFVTNLFDVIFTSNGVRLVNKKISSLEKAVSYS